MKPKVSFVAFYLIWAAIMKWKVPDLHWRIILWLQECAAEVRVLEVFRGAAKSTIYAVYKAWRLYCDPTNLSLVWSADSKLAKRMTRDTIAVLRRHPLCRGMLPQTVGTEEFWVEGAIDARNPSMGAYGVMSNATGGRAHDIDFDDVEVPKNIGSIEGREKLRERISESTHILIPGGRKTYIGTPHTHDSIYDEQVEGGAELLKIPLFEHRVRYEEPKDQLVFRVPFAPGPDGYYVFIGIHKFARLLTTDEYTVGANTITLHKTYAGVIDIYAGCAWPQRFTRKDLLRRRRDTRTLNAWDSQYMLEAKPIHAVRLDPAKLVPYDVKPVVIQANGGIRMMLGRVQIVSATVRWDCALGRTSGDDSALAVILQDAAGRYYWQVAEALTGDVFAQCDRIRAIVIELQLPRVVIETNGIGGFTPAVLRKALRGTGCGVGAVSTKGNKNTRILEAFEAPLSAKFIWAHVDVIDVVWDQMKDWKPNVEKQPDDHLDGAAGAITDQPVRILKAITGRSQQPETGAWRPDVGTFEVELDLSGA